jgi:hypothetical protein
MKNIDLIILGNSHIDYPFFRKFLKDISSEFNKIHYVFTHRTWAFVKGKDGNDDINSVPDYKEFLIKNLPFVNFKQSYFEGALDWRNEAVNLGIEQSKSDGIIFIDNDFHIDANDVINLPFEHDVISHHWGYNRICPSFLYVKRNLIDKTSRFFGTGNFNSVMMLDPSKNDPPKIKNLIVEESFFCDHFFKFTSDLLKLTNDFYFLNENNIKFYHYAGVTHNYRLCQLNELKDLRYPQEYIEYLKINLKVDVEMDERYVAEVTRHIKKVEEYFNLKT